MPKMENLNNHLNLIQKEAYQIKIRIFNVVYELNVLLAGNAKTYCQTVFTINLLFKRKSSC